MDIPTVREALAETFEVTYAQGCPVLGGTDEDIAESVDQATRAEVCVAVLGDEAGLFGNGTYHLTDKWRLIFGLRYTNEYVSGAVSHDEVGPVAQFSEFDVAQRSSSPSPPIRSVEEL